MISLFDKLIFCPKPDYASRMFMWKSYTEKLSGDQARHLNFSLLTRSSAGMTAGSINAVCTRILTERRLKKVLKLNAQIRAIPLTTQEFVEQMLGFPDEDQEEAMLFKEFCEKTPMAKKRGSMNAPQEAEAVDAKAAAKKKKK
jgi:IQ and AAA domain-containing protein